MNWCPWGLLCPVEVKLRNQQHYRGKGGWQLQVLAEEFGACVIMAGLITSDWPGMVDWAECTGLLGHF
jgi:hypothetical protein